VRNTVVMIVLAILAAALWLATWQRQAAAPAVERVEDAKPLGYYIRGARVQRTDEQGRVAYRVFADRLDELPDDERLQLTGVKVEYRPADETPWWISAATASSAKDLSQIDLVGDVELRSAPTDGSEPWTVVTETLRFSGDTSKAEAEQLVEIRVGDWRFDAVGLRVDLKGETLELESQVHGTLVP
jgi:LPS export ABC transporter protein LptC